jgi:hypothetical protein
MEHGELERLLAAARRRLKGALAGLRDRFGNEEWEAYHAANTELLTLERRLAAARGEPYATPLDFPVKWDTGAPLPHLICDDGRAFLVFLVATIDPNWDGTYATIKSPADTAPEPLALVEFRRCVSVKLGAPNDEVLSGHPLDGRGLEPYTAQVVVNSPWLAELERINSVHSGYRPEYWTKLNHYVFWFHDSTFECVAEGWSVEVHHESLASALARVCARFTT